MINTDSLSSEKLLFNFIEQIEKTLSRGTVGNYTLDITQFKDFIQDIKGKGLEDASPSDIQEYLQGLYTEGFTDSTIARKYYSIKYFYRWLLEAENIEVRTDEVELPQNKVELPVILSKEEVRKMIAAASNIRDKALVMFMYDTAVSYTEVESLTIDMAKWEENTILYTRPLMFSNKTKRNLQEYIDARNSSSIYLFVSNQGTPLSKRRIHGIIKDLGRDAGFENYEKFSGDILRHSRATHLVVKHITMADLRTMLGVRDVKNLTVYRQLAANMTYQSLRDRIKNLDSLDDD